MIALNTIVSLEKPSILEISYTCCVCSHTVDFSIASE